MNGCMSWYMLTFSVVAKESHVNPKSGELSNVITLQHRDTRLIFLARLIAISKF